MIVTTGAAGQLGRLVARALAERTSPAGVRLTTRDPSRIADLAEQGFAIARADYDDPDSMKNAFAGASALLLISSNTDNHVRSRQHRTAIDAAKSVGVDRVVYTSFTNPTPTSRLKSFTSHAETEAYLKASGLQYTILRVNQYAENLDPVLVQSKCSNRIVLPGARGKVAYVTRADVAAAIAAVLTQEGHAGRTYEITGPEAVDLYEIARSLSEARGTAVVAVEADPVEYGRMLQSQGMPAWLAEGYLTLFEAVAAGEHSVVTRDAARLAGRALEPMTTYVKRFA